MEIAGPSVAWALLAAGAAAGGDALRFVSPAFGLRPRVARSGCSAPVLHHHRKAFPLAAFIVRVL